MTEEPTAFERKADPMDLTAVSLALCGLSVMLGIAPASASESTPGGPAAWYRFDAPEALGQDASGNQRAAAVAGGEWSEDAGAPCLKLNGQGGLEVPSATDLQLTDGITLDCWVKFASLGQEAVLFAKEGEYLLRLDPAGEKRSISFFVQLGGMLEPRLRSIEPEPDTWYHVTASWNGRETFLRVGDQSFRASRVGNCTPGDRPLRIGMRSENGAAGLDGCLRDVKVYNCALTETELLVAQYGLGEAAREGVPVEPVFEFDAGPMGWSGINAQDVKSDAGILTARVAGMNSMLLVRRLDSATAQPAFASFRMSADAGKQAKLSVWTNEGIREIPFELRPGGEMHSYVVRLSRYPEWQGRLTAIGLFPSDADAAVSVDFLSIGPEPAAPPECVIETFAIERPFVRAGVRQRVRAILRNTGGPGRGIVAVLSGTDGLSVSGDAARSIATWNYNESAEFEWEALPGHALAGELTLDVSAEGMTPVRTSLRVDVAPAVDMPQEAYVPEPKPIKTKRLIGAHYCPLWKEGSRSGGWGQIVPFPEREPLLGWYDEGDPAVADWEIKWCLEHGISFFVYCWYRGGQDKPVEMFLPHAIHEGLFNARYVSQFKFTIMWENQLKGQWGVASEADLMNNLMPFWIENYFKHPSYLVIDNKPVLFIYRPEYLIDDLGGIENARAGIAKMREACRAAGFDGLTILGEYRGLDPKPLELMAQEGLDYTFAYCWPVADNPEPGEAIAAQKSYWHKHREQGIIPEAITVSMGWDSTPWHPSFSKWRIPPSQFQTLCEKADAAAEALPPEELGHQMILLDNWNEFGEGHYIAPHREYGFGYLDAVRAAFAVDDEAHKDLVPEDVGLGPYDHLFAEKLERRTECAKKISRQPGLDPGLVAWWTFDEPDGTPVVYDQAGNGLGGVLHEAPRVPGIRGTALACAGGCVEVLGDERLTPEAGITFECWLRTDVPGQSDKWFANCIYNGATSSGYRFGLDGGRLAWAIPQTDWSHQLTADRELPLGEWVHVAGTCDGRTMRLYMNGEECGTLERPGPIHATDHPLCLGNFDIGHAAAFNGLIDEVRLYDYALSPETVRRHCEAR